MYVKGETNLVADALSRYYENNSWEESHESTQYVNVDARLDPEGEDLPWNQYEESCVMQDDVRPNRPLRQRRTPQRADELPSFVVKHPVKEGIEERQKEAADLAAHKEKSLEQVAPEDDPNPTVGVTGIQGRKPRLVVWLRTGVSSGNRPTNVIENAGNTAGIARRLGCLECLGRLSWMPWESSGISEIAWATNVRFLNLTHGLMIRLAEQPVGCVYYMN